MSLCQTGLSGVLSKFDWFFNTISTIGKHITCRSQSWRSNRPLDVSCLLDNLHHSLLMVRPEGLHSKYVFSAYFQTSTSQSIGLDLYHSIYIDLNLRFANKIDTYVNSPIARIYIMVCRKTLNLAHTRMNVNYEARVGERL